MRRWCGFALLSLIGLCACAPRVQPYGAPSHLPQLNPSSYVAADGTRLRLTVHRADDPRAVIVALHGFNDYRATFDAAGAWWAQHDITTYAYDQRGFGASPQRGIWAGSDALIADAAAMVALVRQTHRDVPVYVLGVSMGGAVALAAADMAQPIGADGMVLVAPAVWGWSTLNPLYRGALWLAAHTVPANKMTGQGLGIVASDNIEMLRALGRDPLIIHETRTDAVYGLVGLMERGYRAADTVCLPTLLLYGARDEVIPREPVEHVRAALPGPVRVAIYRDGYHMLLRDLQAQTVWQDIQAWVVGRPNSSLHGTPLPSGEEQPRKSARPSCLDR